MCARAYDLDRTIKTNINFLTQSTMRNIFRSLLLSAVILSAGFAVSCTEPEPEQYQGVPEVTVAPESLVVPLAGGTTEEVHIVTPAQWVITIDTEGVTVSQSEGTGDVTVTFTVPEAVAMRTIKATVTATGFLAGVELTDSKVITILQSDLALSTNIYYDNCGDAVSKVDGYWPYVDAYTGWAPKGGDGVDQSGVTYTGKNASVRNSGKAWAPVDATYATDAPYAYISKADANFVINNIALKSGEKSYIFSFTVFNQYASLIASPYTPVPAVIEHGKTFKLYASVDGQNWADMPFNVSADGNWQYVVSQFSLPADAEKLHIKFADYVADKTTALPSTDYQYQAALRLDDFSLSIGGEGAVLDFNIQGGDTPGGAVKDIAGILAAGTGNYSIENAWVVATYARGCLVTDATGKYILCYLGDKAEVPAVGAVVKISGDVTEYAGLLQFGQGTAVTATGETKSVDLGTPVTMTGADLDAYVGKPEVKYAQYEGALAVSGYYYNVTVEGAQTAVGSLSYPDAAMTDAIKALDGKGIKVTGFLIGVSSGKFTNTMVTAVAATGNDPQPEPTPDPEPTPGSYLSESFANGQGNWTINDVNLGGLDFVWSAASYGNDKYMKASGYKDGPVATESWLISPEFSLAAATAPELTFNHTHKFAGTFAEELTVWATADNGANWEQLTIPTYGSNNDYTFVSSGAISLTKYVGKSIKIAFKYISTEAKAGTWEVKDVVVAEPGTTVKPEPTPDPTPSDPNASEATITFANAGLANAEKVDGKEFKIGDFVTAVFGQGTASTPTAYYDASKGIRMYQNGSTLDIASSTKTIIAIEFTFDKQHWYFAPDKGTLSAEADVRTWTGEAHNVKFTSTGTDKDHRVYIKSIKVTYK